MESADAMKPIDEVRSKIQWFTVSSDETPNFQVSFEVDENNLHDPNNIQSPVVSAVNAALDVMAQDIYTKAGNIDQCIGIEYSKPTVNDLGRDSLSSTHRFTATWGVYIYRKVF